MRDLPKQTDPPNEVELAPGSSRSRMRVPLDSVSTEFDVGSTVAVMAFDDEALQQTVHQALTPSGLMFAGPDAMPAAGLVLVDAGPDVQSVMGRVRRSARSDAAIVVFTRGDAADAIPAALAAGAFGCLRVPFVREELGALVASALDARAAKAQVADLTRQLDLQAHLASIGRISAGLSHELGNPLSVAVLNMSVLRVECERLAGAFSALQSLAQRAAASDPKLAQALADAQPSSELLGAADDVIAAHGRMEALLRSLRALVGHGKAKVERVALGPLVRDVRRWAAEVLGGVAVEESGQSLEVEADKTMLGQVIFNLVTNAALAARSLPSPRVRFHIYPSGADAIISVRDNGPGILPELIDKIFEPFYTTRRGLGGTGLGLALCREYARQMGAEISVWSAPGRGACFRVRLPRAA